MEVSEILKSSTYTCEQCSRNDLEHHNNEDPLISTIQSVNSHNKKYCDQAGELDLDLQEYETHPQSDMS